MTATMKSPVLDVTKYGTNEVGENRRNTESGNWFRFDTYRSNDGGQPVEERRFSAGPNDASPVARSYADGNCAYNPECSCCWLGFSHTLDRHNKAL